MKTRIAGWIVNPGNREAKATVVWYMLGLEPAIDALCRMDRENLLVYLAKYQPINLIIPKNQLP